jgi:hypothetical protein
VAKTLKNKAFAAVFYPVGRRAGGLIGRQRNLETAIQ